MSNINSTKTKPRYPKLLRLKGLMAEHEITIEELAKVIGCSASTVSQCNNGYYLYDALDMQIIKKHINKKAEKSGKSYSIDEIFYS